MLQRDFISLLPSRCQWPVLLPYIQRILVSDVFWI
jgi:hypothetical protein